MPNKLPRTTKSAGLPGVIAAFFEHDCLKWDFPLSLNTLPMSPLPTKIFHGIPPLEPSPLECLPLDTHLLKCLPLERLPLRPVPLRGLLFISSKPAHIRHRCIDSTFQGKNIIKTHLLSLFWPQRTLPCAVVITAQGRALGDVTNGHHKQADVLERHSTGMRSGKW